MNFDNGSHIGNVTSPEIFDATHAMSVTTPEILPFGRLTKFGLEELIFQEPPLPVVLACYGCKATDAQLFLEDGRALCAACRVLHRRLSVLRGSR